MVHYPEVNDYPPPTMRPFAYSREHLEQAALAAARAWRDLKTYEKHIIALAKLEARVMSHGEQSRRASLAEKWMRLDSEMLRAALDHLAVVDYIEDEKEHERKQHAATDAPPRGA